MCSSTMEPQHKERAEIPVAFAPRVCKGKEKVEFSKTVTTEIS